MVVYIGQRKHYNQMKYCSSETLQCVVQQDMQQCPYLELYSGGEQLLFLLTSPGAADLERVLTQRGEITV